MLWKSGFQVSIATWAEVILKRKAAFGELPLNESTGNDDSGLTCDNQYSGQRQSCLGGGEHTHRALEACAPGPTPLPPLPFEMPTGWWFGSYLYWWNQQVATLLLDHAQQGKVETIAAHGPVNRFEDVSVVRFTGYKPDAE
jgi:hypothetical protein